MTSVKTGRKKEAGEGATLTPKKEKKLKAAPSDTKRLKNKPSAQTVQVPAESTDGSVAFLNV